MKGEKEMKKPNLKAVTKNITKVIEKNSPQILTGAGISLAFTTTVLAVKATPKAIRLIDDEKYNKNREAIEEARDNGFEITPDELDGLKPMEVVKVTWKCYIPAVITGAMSVACLIGANSVHTRRTAALATAYKISETALSEYKEKVVETIGEKKEKVIRDKIAKDKVEEKPVSKTEVIISDKGETLCFDSISGRYFKSDIDTIKKAENYLNKQMLSEMYISLTEFYNEIGLPATKVSDQLGWNIDGGLIEVTFSSQIADDGRPCLVLDYLVAPRYDYSTLM